MIPERARGDAEDLLLTIVNDPELDSAWHDARSMWE